VSACAGKRGPLLIFLTVRAVRSARSSLCQSANGQLCKLDHKAARKNWRKVEIVAVDETGARKTFLPNRSKPAPMQVLSLLFCN
jgi:hypothetical protein